MSHREHFFSITENHQFCKPYFCPDITDWYIGHQRKGEEPLRYAPGSYIDPADKEIIAVNGTLPTAYQGMSLTEIYKQNDWGYHAHLYDWMRWEYDSTVRTESIINGKNRTDIYETPHGHLSREYKLALDGSWCPTEYLIKSEADFPALFDVIEAGKPIACEDFVNFALNGLGDMGHGDLTIARSPFGKLLHEYMGFSKLVYFLFDGGSQFEQYMALQTQKDMEVIALAAQSCARLVILSDHADETLISPAWYKKYCIPFYNQACDLLHQHKKLVSTHLDGNIQGLLKILPQTGFDILDGCTPEPMFNYSPEELAAALPPQMSAFVGVPSAMFVGNTYSTDDLIHYAQRIHSAFQGRSIINVGDILPVNGSIEKVIAVGEAIKTFD